VRLSCVLAGPTGALLLLLSPSGALAAPIFTEDWSSASGVFNEIDSSERWAITHYYTSVSDPDWSFSGGVFLAVNPDTGDQALSLNEFPTHGTATTTLITGLVPGQLYEVSFEHWGDDQPDATPYALDVLIDLSVIGNISRAYSSPGPGASATFSFTATATSHDLTFADVTLAGQSSAIVDNVSVTLVPEPASGALLLGGVAALGLVARRRPAGAPPAEDATAH
jgi:hypothetical protein